MMLDSTFDPSGDHCRGGPEGRGQQAEIGHGRADHGHSERSLASVLLNEFVVEAHDKDRRHPLSDKVRQVFLAGHHQQKRCRHGADAARASDLCSGTLRGR